MKNPERNFENHLKKNLETSLETNLEKKPMKMLMLNLMKISMNQTQENLQETAYESSVKDRKQWWRAPAVAYVPNLYPAAVSSRIFNQKSPLLPFASFQNQSPVSWLPEKLPQSVLVITSQGITSYRRPSPVQLPPYSWATAGPALHHPSIYLGSNNCGESLLLYPKKQLNRWMELLLLLLNVMKIGKKDEPTRLLPNRAVHFCWENAIDPEEVNHFSSRQITNSSISN